MEKRTRQVLTLFVTLILAAGCLLTPASAREEEGKTATILFTHDMHSHLLPAEKEYGGEYGGFARLMTVLEQERAQAAASGYACITVDGGDFSMGTLFQTIYTTRATELRSLGALGYDAATFGNHEYEYRAAGLAKMLRAAAESGDPLPALVQANYVTPKDPEADAEVVEAMLLPVFLPFNLAKGGMNMAATLLIYPPVVGALRRAGVVPPSQSTQGKKFSAGFLLFSLALLVTFVLFALVLAGVI